MPTFGLLIKAELEGVQQLRIAEGAVWGLTVRDPTGEDVREGVTIDPSETCELEGSRGEAHFVVKFKGSKSQGHLNIVLPDEGKGKVKQAYTIDDSSSRAWVPIVAFECRGIEPVRWHPSVELEAEATSGSVFRTIDLSGEGEWCDYDEEGEEPVSIMNLEHKIEKL